MCVAFTVNRNQRALPFRSPVVCLRRQSNEGEKGGGSETDHVYSQNLCQLVKKRVRLPETCGPYSSHQPLVLPVRSSQYSRYSHCMSSGRPSVPISPAKRERRERYVRMEGERVWLQSEYREASSFTKTIK